MRTSDSDDEEEGFQLLPCITQLHDSKPKQQVGHTLPLFRQSIVEQPQCKGATPTLKIKSTQFELAKQRISMLKKKPSQIVQRYQTLQSNHQNDEAVNNSRMKTVVQRQQAYKQGYKMLIKSRYSSGQKIWFNNESITQKELTQQNNFSTEKIVLNQHMPTNSHQCFHSIMGKNSSCFMNHPINAQLRAKLSKTDKYLFANRQTRSSSKNTAGIVFQGGHECSNISRCVKVGHNQYDVYLRIDTNTRGHQNWFSFMLKNNLNKQSKIRINVCNIRRQFKMMSLGQKIYAKKNNIWQRLPTDVQVIQLDDNYFKLSFELAVAVDDQLEVSLLPSFTYSQLLHDISVYQRSKNCQVNILARTIAGLAIPVITLTKDAVMPDKKSNKKLIMISGRVHPSETCSSYITKGLIQTILSDQPAMNQLLDKAVIQIVPMLNPDGVVFGNFRTNSLGDDLNRSFHQKDQTLYPQVVSLKELANLNKQKYGDNFLCFLDIHGHSCKPNSFLYGPGKQFTADAQRYVDCRMFAKLFGKYSRYFSYQMSSFQLSTYKLNTARGFFQRKIKVAAYTIQTSYGLCSSNKSNSQPFEPMGIEQWQQLGKQLASTLLTYVNYKLFREKTASGCKQIQSFKTFSKSKTINIQIKTVKSDAQKEFQLLRKQIAEEKIKEEIFDKKQKQCSSQSDSDQDNAQQDLPLHQKERMMLRFKHQLAGALTVKTQQTKNAMPLPSISPSIFILDNFEKQKSPIPRIRHVNKLKEKELNRNSSGDYRSLLIRRITNLEHRLLIQPRNNTKHTRHNLKTQH